MDSLTIEQKLIDAMESVRRPGGKIDQMYAPTRYGCSKCEKPLLLSISSSDRPRLICMDCELEYPEHTQRAFEEFEKMLPQKA